MVTKIVDLEKSRDESDNSSIGDFSSLTIPSSFPPNSLIIVPEESSTGLPCLGFKNNTISICSHLGFAMYPVFIELVVPAGFSAFTMYIATERFYEIIILG